MKEDSCPTSFGGSLKDSIFWRRALRLGLAEFSRSFTLRQTEWFWLTLKLGLPVIPLDGGRFCHVALIWFVRSSRRHASRAGDPHHRLRQEVRRAGGPGRQGRQLRLRLRRRRPPGAARRAARHQNQGERSELVLERVVQSPSKVQQTFRSSHPILRSKSAFPFSMNLQQILQSRVFSSKLRFNETDLFFSFFF